MLGHSPAIWISDMHRSHERQSIRSCSPLSTLQGVREEALCVQVVPAGRNQVYGHGRWQVILWCADVNPLQVGEAMSLTVLCCPSRRVDIPNVNDQLGHMLL